MKVLYTLGIVVLISLPLKTAIGDEKASSGTRPPWEAVPGARDINTPSQETGRPHKSGRYQVVVANEGAAGTVLLRLDTRDGSTWIYRPPTPGAPAFNGFWSDIPRITYPPETWQQVFSTMMQQAQAALSKSKSDGISKSNGLSDSDVTTSVSPASLTPSPTTAVAADNEELQQNGRYEIVVGNEGAAGTILFLVDTIKGGSWIYRPPTSGSPAFNGFWSDVPCITYPPEIWQMVFKEILKQTQAAGAKSQ